MAVQSHCSQSSSMEVVRRDQSMNVELPGREDRRPKPLRAMLSALAVEEEVSMCHSMYHRQPVKDEV